MASNYKSHKREVEEWVITEKKIVAYRLYQEQKPLHYKHRTITFEELLYADNQSRHLICDILRVTTSVSKRLKESHYKHGYVTCTECMCRFFDVYGMNCLCCNTRFRLSCRKKTPNRSLKERGLTP